MFECKMDCEKCKRYKNAYKGQGKICPTVAEGYFFADGTLVAEPYDTDEYGNIMDESWYRNMANYGVPKLSLQEMKEL